MKRKNQKKEKISLKKKQVPNVSVSKSTHHPKGIDRPLYLFLRSLSICIRYGLVLCLGALVMLVILLILGFGLYTRVVASYSGTDPIALVRTVFSSRYHQPQTTNGRKNILILGTDNLDNRDSDSIRTDTMMVASIGIEKGDIKLLSFPRDLWIASQSTKINALYDQDLQANPTSSRQSGTTLGAGSPKLQAILGDITGLTIHHTLVVDISHVAQIVDAFGGLDVNIERSFVDYQFPRTDVDVRVVRDPKKLYEVVAFTQGIEHMSGDRILKYIRSRHSTDPLEGSDDARVRRQQQVIALLLAKLKDPSLARQPEVLGKLLKLYNDLFAASLPIEEIGAVGWQLMIHHVTPQITSFQLPIEGVSTNPVLTHPEKFPGGAWVYIPIQSDWSGVRSQIEKWITQ